MLTRIGLVNGDKIIVEAGVNEAKEHLADTAGTELQSFHRYDDKAIVYVNPAHVVSLEPYDTSSRAY